jgi:hypothetical protein
MGINYLFFLAFFFVFFLAFFFERQPQVLHILDSPNYNSLIQNPPTRQICVLNILIDCGEAKKSKKVTKKGQNRNKMVIFVRQNCLCQTPILQPLKNFEGCCLFGGIWEMLIER